MLAFTASQSAQRRLQPILRSKLMARLTTPHGVDRYLEQIDPIWSAFEARARVTDASRQTADTVTLRLRPNANWRGFVPGQYLQLSVDIDGRRCTRCFSPANSCHDSAHIELTMRVNPEGRLTRHLRDHVRPGMVVGLSQAAGDFALPTPRPERILLISGGSGITPVMSMLRSLCDEGHRGEITFLHYARSPQDQLYAEKLAALAARHANVTLLRSYENGGAELSGRFSREQLEVAVPDYADATTFLCGPPPMMTAVEQVWAADGLDDRLHRERFVLAASAPASTDATGGELRFARSERLAVSDGATLLEQAEAAGLRPDYGCRMGICHACTCRKTAGRVRDIRDGRLTGDGEEDIQLCVSQPVGDVTLAL
jgi:ferredoxin-NADP reductase